MSPEDYRAIIKELGLTPARPSYDGATVHSDRDGQFHNIPDADDLSPEEREDFIRLLKQRLGIIDH